MRSDKALRSAFRRLQLPTSNDPKAVVATLMPAIPKAIRDAWDELEGDDEARVEFAFKHPAYSHLLTTGVTLPTSREELEWVLAQFDKGLPEGGVVDIGAGAGVTAAVVSLATKRTLTACEPATGAASAIGRVADAVGAEVRVIEAPVSRVSPAKLEGAAVAIAQSALAYVGFGAEDGRDEACRKECSALVSILSDIGDALVIEHATDETNTEDEGEIWKSFAQAMSTAGMYPVWETASFASGYNVFVPDVPAYERPRYARPKLCLRFSPSGDPHEIEAHLVALIGQQSVDG